MNSIEETCKTGKQVTCPDDSKFHTFESYHIGKDQSRFTSEPTEADQQSADKRARNDSYEIWGANSSPEEQSRSRKKKASCAINEPISIIDKRMSNPVHASETLGTAPSENADNTFQQAEYYKVKEPSKSNS